MTGSPELTRTAVSGSSALSDMSETVPELLIGAYVTPFVDWTGLSELLL